MMHQIAAWRSCCDHCNNIIMHDATLYMRMGYWAVFKRLIVGDLKKKYMKLVVFRNEGVSQT